MTTFAVRMSNDRPSARFKHPAGEGASTDTWIDMLVEGSIPSAVLVDLSFSGEYNSRNIVLDAKMTPLFSLSVYRWFSWSFGVRCSSRSIVHFMAVCMRLKGLVFGL